MKKIKLKVVLIFFTFIFSLFIVSASAQSWQELMDSSKVYQEKQDAQTALDWAKKALVQAEKEFGQNDTNYASTLSSVAENFYNSGKLDSAVFYQDIHLKLCRRLFKGDYQDLAESINNMASFYNDHGNNKEAESLFKEALEMYRRLFKGDHPNLAVIISNMAAFYNDRSNYKEAEPLFKEALEMRRRLFKGDHSDLAMSINKMAGFYNGRGKYKEAEPLYMEALEMYRRLFKDDNPGLAMSINYMAMFYNSRGNFKEAEPLYKEALEMDRRIFKGDHPDLAMSIGSMALFYQTIGNYKEAETLYKEALAMNRRLFENDNPGLATGINNMANFYIFSGNYKEAEPLLKEALEMHRRLYKGDHPNLATCINNMAYFYLFLGNYNETEPLLKEALEMNRRLFKGDHPDLAISINGMSFFYNVQGNYKETEPLLKEALGMSRRLFKGDHPDLAISINNMAQFYNSLGNYKEAEPLFKESNEMLRRLFKVDHPDLALSIHNMAHFYFSRVNYMEAELLFKESLEMYRRLFKGNHPDLAKSINCMALFLKDRSRYNESVPLYDELLALTMKNVREYFPYINEQQKADYWSTLEYRINNYLGFGAEYSKTKPEIIEKMVDVTLATKGIVLNSTQKALSKARQTRRTLDEWQSTRQFWLQLVQNPDKAKKMGTNVDSVERAAAELEKEISGQSSEFRKAFDTSLVRWRDVQNKLGTNEAAIEIIRNRGNKDTVKYLILITKKDSKIPELVTLDNGKELENSYIKRYKGLIDIQARGTDLRDIDIEELKELYNQFWKPVQEKLGGISTAYLSMDGVYNQFNPNTLLNPETEKYVLEEIDLRFLTSTRDLVKDAKYANEPKPIPMAHAVLFGAPEFELKKEVIPRKVQKDETSGATRNYYLGGLLDEIAKRGITPLPGTRIEVKKITNSFELKNIKAEDFLGEQALEENVKSAKNPRILHLATHGVFLKDVEYMTMDFESDMKKHVENPLLRSMLLFSGAENTIKGETSDDFTKDDGILTAFEVMNLDLDETDLVVLSACKTGLGEIKNGEGVYGLQRAFKVAGARSIVMSLWSVNDETTQLLMTKFYENWLGGMTKREAFRKAQQHVKERHPDFYYWGAFVMVGE